VSDDDEINPYDLRDAARAILGLKRPTQRRLILGNEGDALRADNARLTTELGEAKAALARTGLAGIYADFTGVADAIRQMAQHIKEQQAQLAAYYQRIGELLAAWTERAHVAAMLETELAAIKGRTCATCKEFGVVDGHGHCNRFLSPRDTWSFCECWEPRKDKEAPKPKCDNCRHWTLTGLGFGRGFCELRPDDGRNWYCCDTCPKWESKEAPDA